MPDLAAGFRLFADVCGEYAPTYERIARAVAKDRGVLEVAAASLEGRTPSPYLSPNLLLAAVHYLLLGGEQDPLAAHYRTLGGEVMGDPWPAFRDFCLRHRTRLEELVRTRLVQTNEVGRSACLLPAFAVVAGRYPGRALALVEVGASAGLNLLWDRYRYDYGPAGQTGDPASQVLLVCRVLGDLAPPIPRPLPQVAHRVGLDLHPIDLGDEDETLWMRALVWPDHPEREELLRGAAALARREPPEVREGHALELLPEALGELPEGVVPCVFHSMAVNQFSPEERGRLTALLEGWGGDLQRISLEWIGGPEPLLHLFSYPGGEEQQELLGAAHPHGASLEWRHPATTIY